MKEEVIDLACEFTCYPLAYFKSNMYLVIEVHRGLLIDPHPSEVVLQRLREEGVTELTILLTHEHFDHISGVNWYRRYFNVKVICQRECALSMIEASNNIPLTFLAYMAPEAKGHEEEIEEFCNEFSLKPIEADIVFDEEYGFSWGTHSVYMSARPGHSPGSAVIDWDKRFIFPGDYMILDLPVLLRLPGGSKKMYLERTLPYLLDLPVDAVIMPGHGMVYKNDGLEYNNGIFSERSVED